MELSSKIYKHIMPDLKDWPIYKFAKNKSGYKNELVEIIIKDLIDKYGNNLKAEIEKCAYSELKRIKLDPWKVDPADDEKFWTNIRTELVETNAYEDTEYCRFQLKRIVNRYVQEIFGDFRIPAFKFARIFLSYFFNRLFNGLFIGSIFNLTKRKSLEKRLLVTGYVNELRDLFDKGIVVLLPTHQSNLDSILIGYIMDYKLGLPAFSYGAGLNLYNFELAGYFMDRLGAYKVDRRKKNSIYLTSLLNFSKFTVMKDVNSIFYPGGTRSRSGKIEDNLKTGLLSSLIDAQFELLNNGEAKKIFVVPAVYNYHSVLEAKPLIYSHLKMKGKKRFMTRSKYRDKMMRSLSMIKSIYKIFMEKSEFVLSIGKPMDVFGNELTDRGESLDAQGKLLDISDYFTTEGQMQKDFQRNIVYTKLLAKSVAKSYEKYNVVLSSHLVAYAAFYSFLQNLKIKDIFDLLKYMESKEFISYSLFKENVNKVIDVLLKKEKKNKIILSDEFNYDIDKLIKTGVKKLGVFHDLKVLYLESKNGKILKSGDFGLLYYYSNRLSFLKVFEN